MCGRRRRDGCTDRVLPPIAVRRDIEYIGSGPDDAGLELLKAAARERLAAGQGELDPGLDATSAGVLLPVAASRMGCC
jgi:hypothetical protein